jgi:hypothetical protein
MNNKLIFKSLKLMSDLFFKDFLLRNYLENEQNVATFTDDFLASLGFLKVCVLFKSCNRF